MKYRKLKHYDNNGSTKRIGCETEATVYSLGDGNCAKIRHVLQASLGLGRKLLRDTAACKKLAWECKVAQDLADNNRSVPKPQGVFKVEVPVDKNAPNLKAHFPGFVMQEIPGVPISKLTGETQERAIEMYNEELAKAKELGYREIDDNFGNGLYVPSQDKVFLIDFADWKKTGGR